jgi:AcrR family transcriptional regulator
MGTTQDGRRDRSEATRTRLLEAAGKLFAKRGYGGTSLGAIEAEAGAHRALVGYHFGNKQDLYSAVLENAIEDGMDLLEPARKSEAPASLRLTLFIDALGALFERSPHFAPIVVHEWMSGGEHMEAHVLASLLRFFQIDREILDQGRANGEFREFDTHSTHLALVGSLIFFQISRPVRERRSEEVSIPPLGHLEFLETSQNPIPSGPRSDRHQRTETIMRVSTAIAFLSGISVASLPAQ